MTSFLNDDEQFVIESLSSSFGGSWRPGEDPPDAYLMQDNVEVAIEISTLTQHVVGRSDNPEPRLSQDTGVLRICDELNEELGDLVAADRCLILTLHAPVDKQRKFKNKLKSKLVEILNTETLEEFPIEISGNNINVHVVKGQRTSGKKVVGIVANKNSSQHIYSNAKYILFQRIHEKTKKCAKVTHRPLWLALFNDYWLAEPDSYRVAMQQYSERHPFGKILLILGNREVHTIYET